MDGRIVREQASLDLREQRAPEPATPRVADDADVRRREHVFASRQDERGREPDQASALLRHEMEPGIAKGICEPRLERLRALQGFVFTGDRFVLEQRALAFEVARFEATDPPHDVRTLGRRWSSVKIQRSVAARTGTGRAGAPSR